MIAIIKIHDKIEIYKKIEQILKRGEAVRFAPIISEDAQNDLIEIKTLLEKVDDGWL